MSKNINMLRSILHIVCFILCYKAWQICRKECCWLSQERRGQTILSEQCHITEIFHSRLALGLGRRAANWPEREKKRQSGLLTLVPIARMLVV